MTNQKREIIAAVQHEVWAHWMKYLFDCCSVGLYSGDTIIPADKVERWKRQVVTSYNDLTEQEKDSDREQADKVIAAIKEGDRQELDEFIFALESTGSLFEKVEAIRLFKEGDGWCAHIDNGDQIFSVWSGSTAVEALINLQQHGGDNA